MRKVLADYSKTAPGCRCGATARGGSRAMKSAFCNPTHWLPTAREALIILSLPELLSEVNDDQQDDAPEPAIH
jgi:hypothetical protein